MIYKKYNIFCWKKKKKGRKPLGFISDISSREHLQSKYDNMVFFTAKKKKHDDSCQWGGGREKEHQTVWCCKVQFNNWTKAVDYLCQGKLHTPTHPTHIWFLLPKLALNMSSHSGAWGNATLASAQCWEFAQYLPYWGGVTQAASESGPWWYYGPSSQDFQVLFSPCLLIPGLTQDLPHSVFVWIMLIAMHTIFSHLFPYYDKVVAKLP